MIGMSRLLLLACVWALSACTALHTSVAKRNLDVQNRMTQTVYLDPVDPELRTIFLDIRQTAPEYQQALEADVRDLLLNRNYRVVDSPVDAQYWLQVNVRAVVRERPEEVLAKERYAMSEAEIYELLNPGMTLPPVAPAVAVATTGRASRRSNTYVHVEGGSGRSSGSSIRGKDVARAVAVVAVLAGAEYAGRQMVKDVYYTMLTDIQIAERLPYGSNEWVTEIGRHELLQGDSGALEQIWERATDRRKYQVRLISFANQANLRWLDAEQGLHNGLIRSLAGIF